MCSSPFNFINFLKITACRFILLHFIPVVNSLIGHLLSVDTNKPPLHVMLDMFILHKPDCVEIAVIQKLDERKTSFR